MAPQFTRINRYSAAINVIFLFVSMIYGAGGSIYTVELQITPRVVQKSKNVTMVCKYDLDRRGVYSVKWYRENQEFYRFSPFERPTTRAIPLSGVHVDTALSNETQVVIRDVTLGLTGNYSCEVIQNAPNYPYRTSKARLDVIGLGGVRATELRITPPVVPRGTDAILTCIYDLTDKPLYSVKWYRGSREIYRYCPDEDPPSKIFPFAGINVDVSQSNATQAVVSKVSFSLSGNFSCEVTADAPYFATSFASNIMEVVEYPAQPPTIETNQHYFTPGDVLRANCTSGPSRPTPELTFYINDSPITQGVVSTIPVGPLSDGFSKIELLVEVQLWPAHYERGAPIIRCESKIGHIYNQDTTVALYTANGDPKIERVTSPGSAAKVFGCQILLILNSLMWLCRNNSL